MSPRPPKSFWTCGLLGLGIAAIAPLLARRYDPCNFTWLDAAGVSIAILTLFGLLWYAWEARCQRLAAQAQVTGSLAPLVLIQWSDALPDAPEHRAGIVVRNLGSGPALDVQVTISDRHRDCLKFTPIKHLIETQQGWVPVRGSTEVTARMRFAALSARKGKSRVALPDLYPVRGGLSFDVRCTDLARQRYEFHLVVDDEQHDGFRLDSISTPLDDLVGLPK